MAKTERSTPARTKATHKTYHVVPENGGWCVRKEGAHSGTLHDRKKDAIQDARNAVRTADRGAIVIHDKHGRIQTESTYAFVERVRDAFRSADKETRSLPRDAAAKHDAYIYTRR